MQFRVLGPVEVIDDDGRSIDVGGAQSRAVLAMLLVAGDRIVPVETILDRLWPERQPSSAASTLQSYVSRLRRALRSPAATDGGPRLVFESGGYRLAVDDELVDARRFAAEADRGRALLDDGATTDAHAVLGAALALWHGPALQDVADQPWARGAATRLDERRIAALEDRVRVDLQLGRHDLVVGELHDLVDEHPLREGLSEHLAVALYRSGRQAEALRVIDDLRHRLVDELGVDPSHRIRELESQILDHDPVLAAPRPNASQPVVTAPAPGPIPTGPEASDLDAGHPGRGGRHFHGLVGTALVGREHELRALLAALDGAAQHVTQWVLIEGEPGIGKSRLLEQLGEDATARGFDMLWGRSYESGASPAFWTWMGAINGLAGVAERLPEPYQEAIAQLQWSAGPRGRIDQTDAGRYQLYEALAQLIVQAGRASPLVIALDDLQWADPPSLELIEFLAGYVIGSPVVFVASVRELEIGRNDALVHAMADLTRRPTARRLHLRGLDEAAAGELVRETVGENVSADVVHTIHRRADGNPFFMTELARLYAADPELSEGEVVRRIAVPAGVRDVIHRRLAHLGGPTLEALQMAAVLGPQVEVGLLAEAMGITVDDALDRLEPALAARLLLDDDDVIGVVHFSHGLVREVLLDDVSALRRARLHLKAADAIEARSNRIADVAHVVADHLWQAASVAPPAHVAAALEQAAMVAVGRFGLEYADEQLERALQLRRTLPADRVDVGAELSVISRLAAVRRARFGYGLAASQVPWDRAKELARSTEGPAALIDLLWTEWAGTATSGDIAMAHRLANELLAAVRENSNPLLIGAVAAAWGIQCWHEGRLDEAVVALDRAALNYAAAEANGVPYDMSNPFADHWTLSAGFHALTHQMAGQPLGAGMPAQTLSAPERLLPYEGITKALTFAMVASLAGDYAEARRLTESGLAFGVDAAFGFFVAAVHCVHGSALISLGDPAAGVAELQVAVEQYVVDGARTVLPYYMSRLALGHLVLGDTDAAAAALARAEAMMAATGELWNEPYLHAARAALAAAHGADAATVDELLDEAQAVAVGQGAHGVAARLAADLSELGLLDA